MTQFPRTLAAAAAATTLASHLFAGSLAETFDQDPSARGWRIHGESSLFHWNAADQWLEVTWDSAHANSYFYQPLGTILAKSDDFGFAFDLELSDIAVGTTPGKSSSFQIALGFINTTAAFEPSFLRGSGVNCTNLVEFDYFPDAGFGATVWPAMVSTNGTFNYSGASDFTVLALETGKRLHFDLRYTAADHTLVTTVSHNGQPYGTVNPVKVADSFADFRVDALAVMSYSDEGQDPTYGGSVLAHGNLDNLEVALPPAPVRDVQPGATASDGVEFLSLAGWTYTLAGSKDLAQWAPVSEPTPGTGDRMTLSPTVPPTGTVFYRIEARRP